MTLDNQLESQPATPAQTAADSGPADTSPIQQRIDRLTRQRHDAERTAQAAQSQNEALVAQLAALTEKVERLSTSQVAPPTSPSAFENAFGAKAPPAQSKATGTDIASLVQNAVQTALQPLQADRQREQLFSSQQDSFQAGATLIPEVLQPNSAAQQLFNQLWAGSPELQAQPNGPEKVIAMVKGLLAGSASQAQSAQASNALRKQLAASPAPQSQTFRAAVSPNQQALNKQEMSRLVEKGQTLQGWTDQEFQNFVGLKLGRANVSKDE